MTEQSTAIGIASQSDRWASANGLSAVSSAVDIGADRIEGDEAQIEQPGNADLEIEAHAHQHEQPDDEQHLADEIAGIEREEGEQQKQAQRRP